MVKRRNRDGGCKAVELCGVKAREEEEERERVVKESLSEGRRGVLRREENQPRRLEEEDRVIGIGRGRWEGREMKEAMVAVRDGPVVAVASSSEREMESEKTTWPKRKP